MNIGLIYGGNYSEGDISRMSAKGIREALKDLKYNVVDIEMDENLIDNLKKHRNNIDVVFNATHGTFGEDGRLQGILDAFQIPYTHSGVIGSALSMNKVVSKSIFMNLNVNVASYIAVGKHDLLSDNWRKMIRENFDTTKIKHFFCKPTDDGSSRDVFMIDNIDSFVFSSNMFQTEKENFMIEERIFGRELDVVILDNKAIGMMEVIPSEKHKFFDYNAKYFDNNTQYIIPNDINDALKNHILNTAELMHKGLMLSQLSRIEVILDNHGVVYGLEANSQPGFTTQSIVPKVCKIYQNLSYSDIIIKLIQNAKYDR